MFFLIRVLQVIGAMDRAGAETFIMNLYRNMDRSVMQFDFLVNAEKPSDYDEEIEELGGIIYRIPRYLIYNRPSYRKAVRDFLSAHPEHAIVHGHIGSAAPIYLEEARKQGRFTIAHSHSDSTWSTPVDAFSTLIMKPVRWHADHFMACSPKAGLNRFGKKVVNGSAYSLVNNGIDARVYTRDEDSIRTAKRTLGLGTEPVFGHVGRFTTAKNHPFLIRAFAALTRQLPDAMLLLVGRGEDESKVRKQVHDAGLDDRVRFLGVRSDVPQVLNAMDAFLFPSVFEGLPVALVEAQAAGLQCVISDQIQLGAVLSDRTRRIPLTTPEDWAREALEAYRRSQDARDDRVELIERQGFDIRQTARWLQEFYLSHAPTMR